MNAEEVEHTVPGPTPAMIANALDVISNNREENEV